MKVIPGKYTASFFATTDRDNAQMASFYPGAMAHAAELSLKDLDGVRPDLVVISPNDPAAMDQYINESKQLGLPYLYDPSQQIVRVEGDTIRNGIEGARALFLNQYEFGMVQKKTGMSESDLGKAAEIMVVTHGGKGAVIYHAGEQVQAPAVLSDSTVDPTGVGDAFRGGFLAGLSRGWPLQLCGQMGALAATYCLEGDGPQGHSYTCQEFVQRFRQHFDDGGRLDALLDN
jgi:adenosine kinase